MKNEKYWELKNSIIDSYNTTCSTYDETRFGETVNYERLRVDEIAKETLSMFLKKGSVLEVGVGTGRYLSFLSKNGYLCYGADLSVGMLHTAKKKFQHYNLFQMDGESLGFKSESFDNVICLVTFGFIINYKKALEEFCRVLKPSGRIIVIYHNGDNWGNKLRIKAFCLSIDTYHIKHRKFSDINNVLAKESVEILYKRDIINFPTFVYHILPKKVLNLSVVKQIDGKLKHGWMTVVVGNKRK